jgi:hypothetical protein
MTQEITITGFETRDVRFPTSLDKTGSDAMNAAGDYSSAYCILQTDSQYTGHGMVSAAACGEWPFPRSNTLTASFFLPRPSQSDAATTLFVLPSYTLPSASRAKRSHPLLQTGVRPGGTSSQTASCAGLDLRRASSTSLSEPLSMQSGISGAKSLASPYGELLPT